MAVFELAEINLSESDFDYFRAQIFKLTGISMSSSKLSLVQSRLRSRLNQLSLKHFSNYRQLLTDSETSHPEWEVFINLLTTNKTHWFREDDHFKVLQQQFIPKWLRLGKKKLNVWCAASSTGEEAYTLALVLHEALKGTGIEWQIKASDIDTRVLGIARNGVYSVESMSQIPSVYHPLLLRGKEEIARWFKLKREIKERVTFSRLNLNDDSYKWDQEFDLIFCRNVLIYFSPETVSKVMTKISHFAATEAMLFIAHSESLQNTKTPWRYLQPSLYAKGRYF